MSDSPRSPQSAAPADRALANQEKPKVLKAGERKRYLCECQVCKKKDGNGQRLPRSTYYLHKKRYRTVQVPREPCSKLIKLDGLGSGGQRLDLLEQQPRGSRLACPSVPSIITIDELPFWINYYVKRLIPVPAQQPEAQASPCPAPNSNSAVKPESNPVECDSNGRSGKSQCKS